MSNIKLTSKKIQIDKAQATIVAVVGCAVFVTVFSLVSVKSLWTQRSYQAKVISKKQEAHDQLEQNVNAVKDLVKSYTLFVDAPTNMLNGNPKGSGDKDGDNARLILDALPSKYDFPALTTSLEKIISEKHLKIESITGTDDEVAQSKASSSDAPKPIDMPFQIKVSGSYSNLQELFAVFEHSIRPFHAQKIQLKGGVEDMDLTIDAKSYYLPEKTLDIKKVDVK
ncbi:hypothetical protein KDA11_01040 [Candidatus Saccharibacteria bacterium]|nr:hypothetical protein [Candidatus Saccharibacteria bacterium]